MRYFSISICVKTLIVGVGGAGPLPLVGGPLDASLGFYLRETFQSQTNTEKILYNVSC